MHPSHSQALPAAQPGVRMARASALLGLLRGSETASLGWWHPVFVSQVMQQQPREFPGCSGLLWTRSIGAEGLAYLCHVHQQLLPCLVLRPREEGADKRFDRLTCFSIVQRASGPAHHELLLKFLFPPCRWTKEGNEFVRNLSSRPLRSCPNMLRSFSSVFIAVRCREWVRSHCASTSLACSMFATRQLPRTTSALRWLLRVCILCQKTGDIQYSQPPPSLINDGHVTVNLIHHCGVVICLSFWMCRAHL